MFQVDRIMDSLGCEAAIREFVADVRQRTNFSVYDGKLDSYVGRVASHDTPIAMYVGRKRIAIALEPEDAAELKSRFRFPVEKADRPTSYVVVHAEALSDAAVRDAALDAVDRAMARSLRRRGRRRVERGSGPAGGEEALCPVHFLVLSLSGVCGFCDGPPPGTLADVPTQQPS